MAFLKSKRRLKILVPLAAGLIVLLTMLMLRWFEQHLIYIPSTQMDPMAGDLRHTFEDVFLTTSDGVRVNGWFFPANTNSPRANLALLVLHGNAGNISHRLGHYQAWRQLGLNVFALDYRGYGRSEGSPSEQGTYRDAEAAYAWLRKKGFAGNHIIALGESLGGGVASELAVRETLGGLVVQSSFTSIPDVGAELYPWLPVRWLCRTRYDTLAKLPRIKCPVLIIHGRGDTLVRFHHAERNFAAANEPKLMWELKGNHNDSLTELDHYLNGMEKFLAQYVASGDSH